MDNLTEITGGKYKCLEHKITEGAYSKVYNVINNQKRDNNYIVKVQKISDRFEAVNEIKSLIKIKKNKDLYFKNIKSLIKTQELDYLNTSKIIDIEDLYSDNKYVYIVFKKYEYTLEEFNILYHQTFKEHLPLNLIKKLINSIFLGLYELNLSKIIHCDIKPNNFMISCNYKTIKDLFKDIKKKKVKKTDLVNYIDLLYIDFNLSQKYDSICKSTRIQTIYYMSPEIILGNNNFNEKIDIWSIGCIIYELLTGKYLFDIYNMNEEYGNNYENYNLNKSNDSNSKSEYDYSYYDDNKDYIILLYLYRELFGDNNFIYGNNISNYYYSSYLKGTVTNKITDSTEFKQYIKNNINIYSTDIQNTFLDIFVNIFTYNYTDRFSVNDYLTKYFFN